MKQVAYVTTGKTMTRCGQVIFIVSSLYIYYNMLTASVPGDDDNV